jgi:hypothetical protein
MMAKGRWRLGVRAVLCAVLVMVLCVAVPQAGRAAITDADVVEAFLDSVFARAMRGKAIDDRNTYTPDLLALMKHANRSEPCLDQDPLLDCQDCTPIKDVAINVTSVSGGTAAAKVSFTVIDSHSEALLTLKRVSGAWRIDEISRTSIPSLRAFLKKCP